MDKYFLLFVPENKKIYQLKSIRQDRFLKQIRNTQGKEKFADYTSMSHRRKSISIPLTEADFPGIILENIRSIPVHCVLNSNREEQLNQDAYARYDFIAGIDTVAEMQYSGDAFRDLQQFHDQKKDWIMGYIGYDIKNETEALTSNNHDRLEFLPVHFFQPRYIVRIQNKKVILDYLPEYSTAEEAEDFLHKIIQPGQSESKKLKSPSLHAATSRETYFKAIYAIKEHIHRGDIYELNFCMEFFANDLTIDAVSVYKNLNELSPMPFSAIYRTGDQYALCASPERFIARRDDLIISQPIKGTARRGRNPEEDILIKEELYQDPKERSENVMITDLVRNDLSRTAQKGSVKVEELFGIYTFKNIHQMISTITSLKKVDIPFTNVIRDAFPMGSMTGAPKLRAMQLIEEFEETKRGMYSGTIGYIDPEGDFDFNVVIRSILYHSLKHKISFMVGSAITANSDPEKEYSECLLKAESMRRALNPEK